MRATTILAIVAIIAALGAVTSMIPVHQVSAQAQGPPISPPNSHAGAALKNADSHNHIPFTFPCGSC